MIHSFSKRLQNVVDMQRPSAAKIASRAFATALSARSEALAASESVSLGRSLSVSSSPANIGDGFPHFSSKFPELQLAIARFRSVFFQFFALILFEGPWPDSSAKEGSRQMLGTKVA